MKIHILYEFREGAWGGGNQFLKALRKQLIEKELYTEIITEADAVLFNSHSFYQDNFLKIIAEAKLNNKMLAVIHRIDGPISLVRGKHSELDSQISCFNNLFADGTVFQSDWSRIQCKRIGLKDTLFETTILNAPDPRLFHHPVFFAKSDKIRLMASSWSANPQKGFDVYQWLDTHLDFNHYEMIFVGNSLVRFKNIRHIPAVISKDLAGLLQKQDIYIQASRNEPCSNALLEALHSGLPALVKNHGGNPQVLGNAGFVFDRAEEIPALVEKIYSNIDVYRQRIALPSITQVTKKYVDFIQSIVSGFETGQIVSKDPAVDSVQALLRTIQAMPPKKKSLWCREGRMLKKNMRSIMELIKFRKRN